MIMTITIMNRLLRAVALGLAVAGGNIAAEASVRLPGEQMNGMPSLAPMLKQITTSVVTITSAGRAGPVKNFSLDKAQRPPRPGSMRDLPVGRQTKATGSGVVIDAQQGLIFTNSHVVNHAEEIVVELADGRKLPAT